VFRSWSRILSLALFGALAVNSCQPESDVLARVGNRTITRGDFLMVAQALSSRYPGMPDSAKVHLLRDITDRELLVQGAMQQGMYRDTSFLDLRRRTEEQLLRQTYYDELGAGQVVVSRGEIEQLHRWRAEEAQVQVVFTLNEAAARAAADQIRRGADFGEVADRFNPAGCGVICGAAGPVRFGDSVRLAPGPAAW